jgi:hypothetical protein
VKKKFLISFILVLALLAAGVIAVNSMVRYGNIDGVWGFVDTTNLPAHTLTPGAECLRYSDGPSGSNANPNVFNNDISLSFDNPAVQKTDTSNWNQIRYGYAIIDTQTFRCLTQTPDNVPLFQLQSGLAFNGVDEATVKRTAMDATPFPLGKLCHINRSIGLNNIYHGGMNTTYIDLTIKGVECGDNGTLVADKNGNPLPGNPTEVDLEYRIPVRYHETWNYDNASPDICEYPTTGRPCSDAVVIGQTEGENFFCKYEGQTEVSEYTVAIIGITSALLDDPSTPVPGMWAHCEDAVYAESSSIKGIFISEEDSINCGCLWAVITYPNPLAVEMNFFEASGAEEAIVLRWQTAFETDNIGFNVYRSETIIREDATQLNQELIKSLVPPGSTFGADYEFVDNSAKPYKTYFYWIEDVDVNGTITTHGPVAAEWID